MPPLQPLAELITFAGENLAYNLKHIADDKLDWKPEPTAKSAYQITAEVVGVVGSFLHFFQNGTFPQEEIKFESREAAQEAVKRVTSQYAAFLATLGPNDMEGEVQLPFGAWPKSRALSLPVVESLHHHGQIAYIQTLLGDEESHFADLGN